MSALFNSSEPAWLWAVFAAIVVSALCVEFVRLRKQGSHAVAAK